MTYHWEPADQIEGARGDTLSFDAVDEQQVGATATRRLSGEWTAGRFQLVIDGQMHTLDYALRCAP